MREVKIRVRVIHPKTLKRLHLKVIVRTKRGDAETVEKDFEIDLTQGTPVADPETRKPASKNRSRLTSDKSQELSISSGNDDQNDD